MVRHSFSLYSPDGTFLGNCYSSTVPHLGQKITLDNTIYTVHDWESSGCRQYVVEVNAYA